MLNDKRDTREAAQHLRALRYTYGDGACLRRWIAQAEAGMRTREGQVKRWRAALEVLEQAQDRSR